MKLYLYLLYNKSRILFGLIFIYLYFFLHYSLYYLFPIYFLNYLFFNNFDDILYFISIFLGIHKKITIDFHHKYSIHSWNLIISNHNSIFDTFVIVKFLKPHYKWFDIKTICKPANFLEKFYCRNFHFFQMTDNLHNDILNFENLLYKWRKENRKQQIILFPEGNIYKNNIYKNFDHVLYPNNAIFNLLVSKIHEIKYIYNMSIIYKLHNKRLIGERNIISNILNPDLKIIVKIDKIINKKNIDNNFLYNIWKEKDNWIKNKLTTM